MVVLFKSISNTLVTFIYVITSDYLLDYHNYDNFI